MKRMESQNIGSLIFLSILPVIIQAGICNKNEVVLVVDTSGTISDEYFQEAKNFAKYIVDELSLSTAVDSNKVALVTYGSTASKRIYCDEHKSKETMNIAIDNLRRIDGELTNTQAGLESGFELLSQRGCNGDTKGYRQSTLVLISDGKANRGNDLSGPNATAAYIRSRNVRILAIGVGDVTKAELVGIAGSEDLVIYGYKTLDEEIQKILANKLSSQICQDNDPGMTPIPVCNCDLNNKSLEVEPFTKYEIIREYEEKCYVDKLAVAVTNITKRIEILLSKLENMQNCKNSLSTQIQHVYPNMNIENIFKAYDACTLSIACSVKEALLKLDQKKEYLENELKIEKAGFGDLSVTGAKRWLYKKFQDLWLLSLSN